MTFCHLGLRKSCILSSFFNLWLICESSVHLIFKRCFCSLLTNSLQWWLFVSSLQSVFSALYTEAWPFMSSAMAVTQEERHVWGCDSAFRSVSIHSPQRSHYLSTERDSTFVVIVFLCVQTVFFSGCHNNKWPARCSDHGGVFGAEWVLALSGWLNCRPLNTSQAPPMKKTVFV